MDAISLLKKDHSYVLRLFNKFDEAGRNAFSTKFRLYDEIRSELEQHRHAEKEIFYPQLKQTGVEGRKAIAEATRDHRQIDALIGQIDRLRADDPNFDDKVQALMEHVERHVEEEEREIFRVAQEKCTPEQLRSMGESILEMRNTRQRRIA